MTSATAKSSEPTIDDILASIRRIIADEQQAENEPAPVQRIVAESGDDVLDLAQPITRSSTPELKAAGAPTLTPHLSGPRPALREPVSPPQEQAATKPAPVTPPPSGSGVKLERLIAGEAEEALAAAFGRISALKVTAETKTLEGLVADLLRPMLKEWLDANLPAIAERLVKQEIDRIAALSGR